MTAYKKAVVMVVLGGVFLSTLGVGTRLMEAASGLQIVFYRALGLAVFSSLLLWYQSGTRFFAAMKEAGWPGFVAGIFLALSSIAVVLAVLNTTVANAMFVISLAPLLSGLFAWMLLGEKVKARTWIAIGIALVGVLVIINGALSTEGMLGIAYAFLMAISYGLFTVSLRFGKDLNMLPCVCWSAYMLLLILGVSLPSLDVPTQDIGISLTLGVFQIGLGSILLIAGSKYVPAAQLTLLAMLEVVLSPIWVWLVVNETPSMAALIGGGIIMCAICYDALAPTKQNA
ncbi:MAG: DMT family transporter [Pseudomonadota bacterium]